MPTRVIDLSMVTANDPSPFMQVKVTNLAHELGVVVHQEHFQIDPAHWPFPGKSFADDFVEMTTHAGTHMDAPYHYGPFTIPDGKVPKTIDEWPLEWCMGDGVVLDIRNISEGHEVSRGEVEALFRTMGYTLKSRDIVLVMTGNDKYWDSPNYLTRGGHLGREALKWILEHDIKLVGTDSFAFERSPSQWATDYHKHGQDPRFLWPCHLLGLEIEYAQIEKMTNLDLLPPFGFRVIALPIKIFRGSAGFVRAVALVDD
jgi:kynurenine formamidase